MHEALAWLGDALRDFAARHPTVRGFSAKPEDFTLSMTPYPAGIAGEVMFNYARPVPGETADDRIRNAANADREGRLYVELYCQFDGLEELQELLTGSKEADWRYIDELQ